MSKPIGLRALMKNLINPWTLLWTSRSHKVNYVKLCIETLQKRIFNDTILCFTRKFL